MLDKKIPAGMDEGQRWEHTKPMMGMRSRWRNEPMLSVGYEGKDQELEMGQKKQGSLDAMRLGGCRLSRKVLKTCSSFGIYLGYQTFEY